MDINVKRLVKDLNNFDDDLRTLSAMTLLKIDIPDRKAREEVIQALMKATRDKNVSVRFFARKAIDKFKKANLEDEGHIVGRVPLDQGLESDDFRARMEAVLQIGRSKKIDYKDRLVALLATEGHAFVKASIVSSLRYLLTTAEAGILSPFLNDPDSRVRSNTIEALEALKAEEAIPLLFPSLEDPDNRIRAVAAKALASFGEEKVFAVMKKMLTSDEDWMKGSAIYALSHIQAGEAINLLVEAGKDSPQMDTRLKAIIALANYHDVTSFGFLKHLTTVNEEPIREAANRALKLCEEKFGTEPPTTTLVVQPEDAPAPKTGATAPRSSDEPGDLTSTVTRFFRKGKEEAVGMSQRAAINFAMTDLEKEQTELQKEAGRVVFEIYQQGELQLPELLTIGHEILRMNFFVGKYADSEEEQKAEKSGGFFAQLKSLFSKSAPKSPKAQQADKFIQKREELFLKLGCRAFEKMQAGEFQAPLVEGYLQSYQMLTKKIEKERQRLGA